MKFLVSVALMILLWPSSIISAEPTLQIVAMQGYDMVRLGEKIPKTAYQKLGITVEINAFPSKRGIYLANDGKLIDGELSRISGIEKDYPNLIKVAVSLAYIDKVVFSKKHSFKIE